MKSILVPINFSNASINALRTALDIAQQTGNRIIMLHNMDEDFRDDADRKSSEQRAGGRYWQNIHEERDLPARLELLRGLRIQYHVPKLQMEFIVCKSMTKKEFEKLIRQKDICMIVGGLAQMRPKIDILLESIRIDEAKVDIPILFVGDHYTHLRFDKILLIGDTGDDDTRLIRLLESLRSVLECKLYVTHRIPDDGSRDATYFGSDQQDGHHEEPEVDAEFVAEGKPLGDPDLRDLVSELEVDLAASTNAVAGHLPDLDNLPIHQIDRVRMVRVPQLV